MWKGCKKYMAEQLSTEELAEYKEAFSVFDKNGDGTITMEELGTVMKTLRPNCTSEEIRTLMHEIDTDGNGTIDFNEFVVGISKKRLDPCSDQDLREIFNTFDADGNGFICRAELRQVMLNMGRTLTDEELDDMVRQYDSDGNGQIDFPEFTKLMSMH